MHPTDLGLRSDSGALYDPKSFVNFVTIYWVLWASQNIFLLVV